MKESYEQGYFPYKYLSMVVLVFFFLWGMIEFGAINGYLVSSNGVLISDLQKGYSVSMNVGDSVAWNVDKLKYNVKLSGSDGIGLAAFFLDMPNDFKTVSIKLGENEKVNLDNGDVLEIKFDNILDDKLKINFKLNSSEKNLIEDKKSIFWLMALVLGVIALLIIIILIIILVRVHQKSKLNREIYRRKSKVETSLPDYY
ncbi:hypothetical protein COU54_01080 [Candidatus Pacearchaeota archaeon CG10_big_fil_rev_8_21_14_0_10_31_24]|nr:MAG: hypothetical protein COU54_01080 [Candidatus Pacearchaeota archaeon CG10_big_fil_rev_8_21_14_0_10_31_24]